MAATLKKDNTPFYTRLAMVLVSIIALCYLAILGKKILSPLLFSLLFSIVLLPLASFLEKKCRLPRSIASLLAVLILVGGVGFILYMVGAQLSSLLSDWPMFKDQFSTAITNLQHWVSVTFHINTQKQNNYINGATADMLSTGKDVLGATVNSLSSTVLFLVFMLFDTFFLLFYRRLILRFLLAVFRDENSVVVRDIITNVQNIIRQYILGLLLEMAIVAAVCCIAFEIMGIKYAILLGLIIGLFNVIPYIGIFTALVLSMLITFATGASGGTVLIVGIVIIGIHLLDANLLLPIIVSSKVKINALITILAVVVGEMLWGISGTFLAIPVVAIAKIIFDRVDTLKPWGILLGEEKDDTHKKPMKVKADTGKEETENVEDTPEK